MKASAEKSVTLASTPATRAASQPFFAKAGASSFFEPAARPAAPAVQLKMQVNQPGDAFEQEADRMADQVVRAPMPLVKDPWHPTGPASLILNEPRFPKTTLPTSPVQRAALPDEKRPLAPPAVQRQSSASAPTVGASVQAAIRQQTTGGQPLAADVRSYMEPRFGADFSQVRVHHDAAAAGLSAQLSARAFTHQNHVFFSPGQYQPGTSEGRHLLAHELTHTIQQGHAVQRSPQVAATATAPPIQRLGLRDLPGVGSVLDYFAEAAYLIPGFRLLTLVVGFNPITQQTTDRSAANLLRALIELMPAGFVVAQALDNHGVFTKAGAWVEQRLAAFRSIGGSLVAGLRALLSGNPLSLLNPGALWAQARQLLAAPVGQLISFAGSVAGDLLHLVKTAILKPLAALAEGTAGYDLLKALLGEDPVTGEPVPRNADTLLGGFMKLIGQEEIWQNLKKGNAVPRAWAWFQGALAGLLGFARSIPQRVGATLASLTFQEVLTVAGAFGRVVGNLAGIAGAFISWGLQQVISLLEILFSVVAPGAIPYIKKAQGAFQTILRNPIGFVNNLVQAGKLGFIRFAGNIAGHLMKGLLAWLTAPMARAGIYVLQSFSLPEILKMVASALGLTWPNIRKKLLKIIPEPVLVALEKTAGILVTFVQQGPAAALEQIKGELTALKDQLISQVIEMVTSQVVQAAVTKLVSLFNPAGAVIQAILAIYNTISVFINQLSQIGAVVAAFIDSIAAIAAGQLEGAAKKVEQTMAGLLPIVIAFFAKFAGAGSIPDKLFGLVMKGQKFVDKGIDKVVAWLGGLLKKLGAAFADKRTLKEKWDDVKKAVAAVKKIKPEKRSRFLLMPLLKIIKLRYRLTELSIVREAGNAITIRAFINPEMMFDLSGKPSEDSDEGRKISKKLRAASQTQFRLLSPNDPIERAFFVVQKTFDSIRHISANGIQSSDLLKTNKLTDEEGTIDLSRNGSLISVGKIILPGKAYKDADNPIGGPAFCAQHISTETIMVKDATKQQYLNRFVVRDISIDDYNLIRKGGDMITSSYKDKIERELALKKKKKERRVSAITVSPLDHVTGAKPSNFLSASLVDEDKHNEGLDNGEVKNFYSVARAKIDLFQISSNDIFDLSTRIGQEKHAIFTDIRTKKNDQAVKDTIRTKEVLIRGNVPASAIKIISPPVRTADKDPTKMQWP